MCLLIQLMLRRYLRSIVRRCRKGRSISADGVHAYDDQVDVMSYAAREVQRRTESAITERPTAFGGIR